MSMGRLILVALALLGLQAVLLYVMGQPPLCECGIVRLWHGIVLSPENSQQLTDWYTLSHVIHGLIFYWALSVLFPRLSIPARFLIALGVEVGWEIVENTPWLIEHYRQQALAQGYVGDSVLNSVADTLAMAIGFFAAQRLPVWTSVVLLFVLEATALYAIRDSLVLNILGFFHQFPLITEWQSGL